ncbi:hypothetical protein NEHOM01_1573 [Nematocida homosporus]|uniref:uncharacterized protein n=1 Tax=Nematocida homosporus TaxID=1912981 RepID=UPI00221FB01C|nr:uncharacterized protein NEHOM01_1573 [Nematocida homosporus]KAI5186605.1 hypothetical protein NEHOM01_1573 [Nematocida homosporus]
MEETKELLLYLSDAKDFISRLGHLRNKLTEKEKKIKESTLGVSKDEAKEMIGILKRKLVCLQKWGRLVTTDNQ